MITISYVFNRLTHIHVDFRLQNKNCFRTIHQPILSWWAKTNVVHYRSAELRALFTDTLNKATQGYIAHTPLRMITSLTLKSKDTQKGLTRSEEGPAHKMLLLLLVRLIHADPMLLLNVVAFKYIYFEICFFFFKYKFLFTCRHKAKWRMKCKVPHSNSSMDL